MTASHIPHRQSAKRVAEEPRAILKNQAGRNRSVRRAKLFSRILNLGAGGLLIAVSMAGLARASCQLNSPSGKIKHVVYVEFDNVHFTRDNPNVPSDLEQMPNLLNFIKKNGTMDAGDHTILISHTAEDILTTETGLYSDDDGIFIGNNFGVFGPGSGLASVFFPSSFFYWTDTVADITPATDDNTFALTTPSGDNVPGPWVPFTRAGCDVGAFSTANIVLEEEPADVKKVFGASSPQASETAADQTNDFIGAAIHCAKGSSFCTAANNAVSDLLPDEPNGYSGYQALFGLKYIAPALGGITDYNGNRITGFGNIDFDPVPAQTLAVVETMLKHDIPVVFAYIADAHDNQAGSNLNTSEQTFGPGEAPYVQQLAKYNAAFGTFFANLKKDGIDETNTLFIFTPDEGDHNVAGAPTPANCDGVKITNGGTTVTPDVFCTYGTNGVGEVDVNFNGLVAAGGDSTQFAIHFDSSPTVYVPGRPSSNDPGVRQLERTMASLSAVNPHTGLSESLLGTGMGPDLQGAMVDAAGQKLLHMNTIADPARSPTFTFFGNPNFFFESSGSLTPTVFTGDSWNHGDLQPEIARTFIGIAGPGVQNLGVTQPSNFFTDHVDVRPTLMFLTGLTDDYQHDGRVILELLDRNILPSSLHANSETLLELGQIYKQINAPFGQLAESMFTVSTFALQSNSTNDTLYTQLEDQISSWTAQRDSIASQIKEMLEAAEFDGQSINEQEAKALIAQGQALLNLAAATASSL
jgi:hypothetical protein